MHARFLQEMSGRRALLRRQERMFRGRSLRWYPPRRCTGRAWRGELIHSAMGSGRASVLTLLSLSTKWRGTVDPDLIGVLILHPPLHSVETDHYPDLKNGWKLQRIHRDLAGLPDLTP